MAALELYLILASQLSAGSRNLVDLVSTWEISSSFDKVKKVFTVNHCDYLTFLKNHYAQCNFL